MVQLKVFFGTIDEIQAAFNAWGAGLVPGVNINAGPLTPVADALFLKEVMYVLPTRSNGNIAVPQLVRPKDLPA